MIQGKKYYDKKLSYIQIQEYIHLFFSFLWELFTLFVRQGNMWVFLTL